MPFEALAKKGGERVVGASDGVPPCSIHSIQQYYLLLERRVSSDLSREAPTGAKWEAFGEGGPM